MTKNTKIIAGTVVFLVIAGVLISKKGDSPYNEDVQLIDVPKFKGEMRTDFEERVIKFTRTNTVFNSQTFTLDIAKFVPEENIITFGNDFRFKITRPKDTPNIVTVISQTTTQNGSWVDALAYLSVNFRKRTVSKLV